MVACKLADATFLHTCAEAIKLSVAAYALPFLLLTNPLFLLNFQNPLENGFQMLSGLTAIALLICALQKYCFTVLTFLEQALFLCTAALLSAYGLGLGLIPLIGGVFAFPIIFLFQHRAYMRHKMNKAKFGSMVSMDTPSPIKQASENSL